MGKRKLQIASDRGTLEVDQPSSPTRAWASSPGTYLGGRAYLDEADATAASMEAKWGAGRLRLLVGPELREKFDRQRYLLNQAVWHGQDMEQVRRESLRMVKAWLALDKAATEIGEKPLSLQVWEITLADGSVAAIVPDGHHASAVETSGRAVNVYTLEEIGRLLETFPAIAKAKAVFPGASVTAVRRTVEDPLDAFTDSERLIDAPLVDDEIPF